jgi:hypothetical protein
VADVEGNDMNYGEATVEELERAALAEKLEGLRQLSEAGYQRVISQLDTYLMEEFGVSEFMRHHQKTDLTK